MRLQPNKYEIESRKLVEIGVAADESRHKIEIDLDHREKLFKTAMPKLNDEERIAIRYYLIDKS